ncbi:phosphopantetheine-binding protein (plasmid) [Streptomyces sp. NBC_00536]|uniref:acyl carrier protein n=1 Tax=Streptomyces sp. NBC_00536 TaxID=2975769 RepID=UPI002E81EE23|nr:acyl carrier protein [Streptomyces sp. NBC_00536]WUC84158.1 phosphopantetheine-binding protein [Streptomyces sp. NBC_00536]
MTTSLTFLTHHDGLRTVLDEVRAVWATLLKITDPPLEASFFELGGDSLAAHHMLLHLSRTYGVELRLRQIYETPTIATLAEAVAVRIEQGRST